MKARRIEKEDYLTYRKWLEMRGRQALPRESLPYTGAIVDDVCIVFLYTTNSNICITGWQTSNPKSSKVREGLDLAMQKCIKIAESIGKPIVFSYTNHKSIERLCERNGFKTAEQGIINQIYKGE